MLEGPARAVAAGDDVEGSEGSGVEIDARAGVAQEGAVPVDVQRVVAAFAVVKRVEAERKRLVRPGTRGAGGRDAVLVKRKRHAARAVNAGVDEGDGEAVGTIEVEAAA